jgi:prepilin peptidase CpaA
MHFFVALALVTTAGAAVFDWRKGEIPNWLSLGSLALAVLAHLVTGAVGTGVVGGLEQAGFSILGAVACGVVPFAFWQKGAFGGGDVKMLAAVGAALLPLQGIEAEFYALLAAAIVAPARLAWEGRLLRVLGNTMAIVANPLLPKARRRTIAPEMLTSLRFGPAIFAGALVSTLAHWRG